MGDERNDGDDGEHEIKIEDCKLKQFERNKYFYGKLMTVSDLDLEQRYFNEKRHLVNRLVHGSGIVCGLEVAAVEKTEEKCICGPDGKVETIEKWVAALSAGVAFDGVGREIVVSKSDRYFVSEDAPEKLPQYFGLYVRRNDILKDLVPSPANTSSCDDCYSHIEEDFELVFGEISSFVKILFDRTTYSANDEPIIYLIEEWTDTDVREVKVSIPSKEIVITLNSEFAPPPPPGLAGWKIFRGSFKLEDLGTGLIAGSKIMVEYSPNSEEKYTSTTNVGGSISAIIEKKRIGDDNYKIWLRDCLCCENPDPKVLLSVLTFDKEKNEITVVGEATTFYRKTVYNNPELYDLITQLLIGKAPVAPAEPVRAIETINHIGNKPEVPIFASNIDLVSTNGSVRITTQGNEMINLETASIAGSNSTTGEVFFEGIKPRNFRIETGIVHKSLSPDGSPPAINLALNGQEMVNYMEDMLLYSLYKDVKGIAVDDQDALREISDNPDDAGNFYLFFKAIRINKETFTIFIANLHSEMSLNAQIKWWAIPASHV